MAKKNKNKNKESNVPSLLELTIAFLLGSGVVIGIPTVIGAFIGGVGGAVMGGGIAMVIFFTVWSANKNIKGSQTHHSHSFFDFDEGDPLGSDMHSGWGPEPTIEPVIHNDFKNHYLRPVADSSERFDEALAQNKPNR